MYLLCFVHEIRVESDSAKLSSPRLSRVKRSRPGYTADSKSCESHGATNQVFTQQGLTFLTETLMQHADGHSWRDMVRREILQTDTSRCSCKGRFGHPPTPLAHVTASALAPSSAALSTPDPLLSSSSSNRSLPLWLTSRVHRQRKRRPKSEPPTAPSRCWLRRRRRRPGRATDRAGPGPGEEDAASAEEGVLERDAPQRRPVLIGR